MKRLYILLSLLFFLSVAVCAQTTILGNWRGKIDLGMQKLNIGFQIKGHDNGSKSGLMDVPEQGAMNIPVELKMLTEDSLEIVIPALGASYNGRRASENLIEGTFSQRGMKFALNLEPGKVELVRPQTPRPPFAYPVEEVEFRNEAEGAVLSGTLTYPIMYNFYAGKAVPVVLMVTGSGTQNRDEELFDHKPFAVMAHFLAMNGIASLRYDDRGAGKSTGPLEGVTTQNFKADADAGIAYLRSLGKFSKVGVLGHSEGGLIAFMMGAEEKVDFVVSLAGSAQKGIDVLIGQNAAMFKLRGVPDMIVGDYCRALRAIYTDRIAGVKVDDPKKYVSDVCTAHQLSLPAPLTENLELLPSAGGPWMDWFLAYDPCEVIRKIKCPVFALNGSNDLQVLSKDNLPVLRDNLPENGRSVIKEYDALNHLFQHCTYAKALDYGAIEETISKEVLEDVAKWINLAVE